jgi:uracil-DNA glycosylase family 4
MKLDYLDAMGIDCWQRKNLPQHETQVPHSAAIIQSPDNQLDWQTLRANVASCTACGLDKTRTQTVFGVGNQNADLMIIGEAPGFYEDKQGEPFVGRAGKLLNAMLAAIGLDRKVVYIGNVLKCRPPNNRDPLPPEVALCTPYLIKQINLLQPKLLLALGRIASHYLLDTKMQLGKLRQQLHIHPSSQIPMLVTYHPAYLLRNPKDKAKAMLDLNLVVETLRDLAAKSN